MINGLSIVDANGGADIPCATDNTLGVVKTSVAGGIFINNGGLYIAKPSDDLIKGSVDGYRAVTTGKIDRATFYGLAKAASDTTQSASSNSVGTYTDAAKVAIQKIMMRLMTLMNTRRM